ncbi:kynurenine 3-monooxygenase [Thermomonospora echinospora]|uniref:Kynurenine 3-monooxygenase n=2 Tax=Thermomonospora echinospora TaxID=1992 RepID=A0A1H6DFY7_9ACTN|nr:kynurenine 3-monooxygenase [Thermomonospora echinospora]
MGCLLAAELRRRGFDVDLYERNGPPGQGPEVRGRSFNLTLTYRGLSCLGRRQREAIYAAGVKLPQRIVHRRDGSVTYQPYGVEQHHHLLSIPRSALHRILLEQAVAEGARVHYGHTCVAADARRAEATFVTSAGGVSRARGDLLAGCDGANSLVRHELSKSGARMRISQEYIPHGHVEIGTDVHDERAMRWRLGDPRRIDGRRPGMHLWPRGDYFLQAQPNLDGTFTTTLFMPLERAGANLRFRGLRDREAVRGLFARDFPDIAPALPRLAEEVHDVRPAQLKLVRCAPYHHERAVLLGDAAHTLVPFYGQGINCSFEDVAVLCSLYDRHRRTTGDPRAAVRPAIAEFSELRVPAGHAITELSLANLEDLSSGVGQERYHARRDLERKLHRRHPACFVPLYQMVAFTRVPYHEVVERYRWQERALDRLCDRYDQVTEAERIIAAYPALVRGERRDEEIFELALSSLERPA